MRRGGHGLDSPKYRWGLQCPTLLCSASRPPLKRPYSHFRGEPALDTPCRTPLHSYTTWNSQVINFSRTFVGPKGLAVVLPTLQPRRTLLIAVTISFSSCALQMQGHISRGIHGLPKVSLGPYNSMPCGPF
jgi:hypothetical protein